MINFYYCARSKTRREELNENRIILFHIAHIFSDWIEDLIIFLRILILLNIFYIPNQYNLTILKYMFNHFFYVFRCYSYDYGDTGVNVCRLSHHASSTLYLIDEPYIRSETAVTYERGSCYNVTIECQVLQLYWNIS